MQSQPFGGIAEAVDLPTALAQHLLDVRPLDRFERRIVDRRYFGALGTPVEQRQRFARLMDQRPFDDVLEFADVARP